MNSNIRGLMAVRNNVNPVELIRGIQAGFESHRDNTKARLDSLQAAVDSSRADTERRILGLQDHLVELAQAAPTNAIASFGGTGTKSLASILSAAPEFEQFRQRRADKVGIPVTAADLLRPQAATIINDDDVLSPNHRLPGIVYAPQRRVWLRERLHIIPVTGSAVEYSKEASYTNNAATQAAGSPVVFEAVQKAESAFSFQLVNVRIPTVAHFVRASRQVLDDSPALANFLDMRLRYGLDIEVERQIISGDGTSGDMLGIAAQATTYVPASGDSELDTLSQAKAWLENANYQPDCVVLNPLDYGRLERIKTTTGEYVIGQPTGALQPVLWGVPVFKSATIPQGKFLMFDSGCVALFLREDAVVRMSEADGDTFIKNVLTLLAEVRMVVGVLVPAGVLYGDLTL